MLNVLKVMSQMLAQRVLMTVKHAVTLDVRLVVKLPPQENAMLVRMVIS